MKSFIYVWALFFLGCPFYAHSQEYTTIETKVVLVAPLKTDSIKEIILLNTFEELHKEKRIAGCMDCRFFIGVLTGTYTLNEHEVLPLRDATIIIFTNKLLYPNNKVISETGFYPSKDLKLGKTSIRVVGNKKGELILKVL